MKKNNGDGLYDNAILRQRQALKYFMSNSPFRKELPSPGEDTAAAA